MLAKARTSLLSPKHVALLKLEPKLEGHELDVEPRWAGFKIPYFDKKGKVDKTFYRFRFLQTRPSHGFAALAEEPEKPRRYGQPAGTSCHIYMPPLLPSSWDTIASDPDVPLVVTEGELKAACACANNIACIGLGGVYSWRSKKQQQILIPDLAQFMWDGRSVNLCFDSDVESNPMVKAALSQLAVELTRRGAKVFWTPIPSPPAEGAKHGLDDYALMYGVDALIDLLANHKQELAGGVELHRLNTEVALVRATGEVLELATNNVYSPSQFSDTLYRNRVYEVWVGDKPQLKPAAKEWIAWAFRNEVERLEYEPSSNEIILPSGGYNTWVAQGWGCKPSATGSVEPWTELLARVMTGLSREHMEWVRRWFAYPLQHPGTKLATAILLWGRQQGTGKTLLGETMSRIYGVNYGTVSDKDLTGQFNEWAVQKQFVVGDEISIGDRRQTTNNIKDMITRSQMRVNIKNRRTYAIRDCINYYFTSNHDDAIHIDTHDRRLFVHQATSNPLQPSEYQSYLKWLDKEGGASRLFHHLLREVDCAGFDPAGRAPLTAAKLEMTASTRSDLEDYAYLVANQVDLAVSQPYDLFRTSDLLAFYDPESRSKTRAIGMGRALAAAGVFKVARGNNTMVIDGMRTRLWAVRNAQRYRQMGPTEAARAYAAERERNPRGVGSGAKFSSKERVQ